MTLLNFPFMVKSWLPKISWNNYLMKMVRHEDSQKYKTVYRRSHLQRDYFLVVNTVHFQCLQKVPEQWKVYFWTAA